MATDLERLVVSLDADVNKLTRQLAKATGDVETFERKADASTKRAAKAMNDNMGRALRSDQIANLRSQALDVGTSLSGGASVLQVMSQQSAQIYEALAGAQGGVSGAVKDLAGRFTALLTPTRLVAGGVASIATAAGLLGMRWEAAQEKIEAGLAGVGRASGATVGQINDIAAAAARSGQVTASAAREAATAMAATGKIDVSNIPAVLNLVPGYAKLFGKGIAEAGTDLAKIFADPVKGADELDARLGLLDDRTRQYIRTLAMQGDRQGAIRTLAQLAQPELDLAAAKTSLWARAWNSVEAAADAAGHAVARATTGGSLDDRRQETERRRQAAQVAAGQAGNVNPVDPATVEELRRRGLTEAQIRAEVNPIAPGAVSDARALAKALAAATLEAEDLNEQRRRQGAQGFNDTENVLARERSKLAGETARAVNGEGEALSDLEKRYEALQATVSSNRALGMLDDARQAQASVDSLGNRIKQLRADFEAGGSAAAAAARAARFQEATAGASAYARGLMEINRQFDEMRRNIVASTDAQQQASALAVNERNRATAIGAFNTETRERARGEIAIPGDYYTMIRAAESGTNDRAVSGSGAVGRYQFTKGTWLDLFEKVKPNRYGSIKAEYSDAAGKVDEAGMRAAILALRNDPNLQEELVRALTQRNAENLDRAGFASTSRNLYLAHNVGTGGAKALLRAERDGQAGERAQGVLDRVDPALVANNRAYYGNGRTVAQALAAVDAKARGASADSRAQQDRVRGLDAETASTGKSVAERERLASVEEQLRAARERGDAVADRFTKSEELLKTGTVGLTGEVKAQTAEILRNAEARAQAAARNLNAGLKLDLSDSYAALGRTPGEQQDVLTARRFGAEGTQEFRQAYEQLQDLRDLTTAKSDAGGVLKSINADLLRGATLADAMKNAVMGLLAKVSDRGIDLLLNMAFGGGSGGGGGNAGGFVGSLIGALSGGVKAATGGRVTGPGSGTSDSIGAWLSNGEFVVNAAATRAHLPLLEALNAGRAPRFAAGGLVGAMPPIAMARPALAGGGFTLVDQRPAGSPDLAPTARRNASGGTDVILRQADAGLARRGRNGQGALAPVWNTAGNRLG